MKKVFFEPNFDQILTIKVFTTFNTSYEMKRIFNLRENVTYVPI